MSRSLAAALPCHAVAATLSRCWHAACLIPVAGCFYVERVPDVEVDNPPVILFPETSPQRVRVLDGTVVMTIRASDPEGARVNFDWPELDDVPHTVESFTIGPVYVSRVTVVRPDRLPSSRVTALVFDGSPVGAGDTGSEGNTVRVVFEVEP